MGRTIKLLFLLCMMNYSFAQSIVNENGLLFQNLSAFREESISNQKKLDLEFNEVLETWKELEPDFVKLEYFIFNSQYSKSVKNNTFRDIKEMSQEKMDSSSLSQFFTENQLNAILKKPVFLLLISMKILDYEYPYKILDNPIFKEIAFYNIKDEEVICEIGAGQGIFSLLMYFRNPSQKIYINEIDQDLLNFIKENILIHTNNSKKIITLKGGKNKSNLPEKVDKIILRNTFHHFSKKKKMMNSIKSNLNEKGLLLISETLKTDEPFGCSKKMSEVKIKEQLQDYGFILLDELKIENKIYLKCMKK